MTIQSEIDVDKLRMDSRRIGDETRKFSGTHDHYPVSLTINGPSDELDKIANVRYRLHHTFKRPVRYGTDRSRNFETQIWTWGFFDVEITLYGLDSREYTMTGRVQFT